MLRTGIIRLCCWVWLAPSLPVTAQRTDGITGKQDTSYTLQSAFQSASKTNPETVWPSMQASPVVVVKKGLRYCTTENGSLATDVFYPSIKKEKKRTALLLIHGGGWRSGAKELMHPLAQQLALKGYVCFTPQYRLSTEALFPAAVHDLKAAVRWVRSQAALYHIDTGRIVVAGHSAGGELAAFLGATNGSETFDGTTCVRNYSSAVQAVVDMDGILAFLHPESGEGDDSKKTSAATYWLGASKTEDPQLWQQASPLTQAGPAMPPFLFINSSVARMHAGRDDFTRIMDRYGIYHEVKTFETAPHSFPLFEPWLTPTVAYIHSFLEKVFNGTKRVKGSYVSRVWVADQGDGTYKNPVLHADYSDPDAIRVGTDYYMTASSFEDVPGLPVLHSKDLVNWTLIGHALKRLPPFKHFSVPRHGEGVWAPSIRYHNNLFYIYYPDPDFGIYVVTAKDPAGPWTDPVLVEEGKGLIDPCPLWDDNGQAYLVHAFAGSRKGIKSVVVVKKMNRDGKSVTDEGVIVYDGHAVDPTIEGPKLYKRNGWYYIFAPAGGVATGWQTVLRSKNIYGPYERKVVMDQGSTTINGPHQGAWVTTQTGEHWFLHFQDKEAYGRVVHLQPMRWVNDWPVIGMDRSGQGKGEPVLQHKKPGVGATYPVQTPAEDDEFNGQRMGLQWQWMGNPKAAWSFLQPGNGSLRLYAQALPDSAKNMWGAPHVLLQKFPAEAFTATAKMTLTPNKKREMEKAGIAVMGLDYATLSVKNTSEGTFVVLGICKDADKGNPETERVLAKTENGLLYFRVQVTAGGTCRFSYSLDGQKFTLVEETFKAVPGKWKGAKLGLFCSGSGTTNDAGYVDVDWFRITAAE